jgi:hypothetical protein
MRKRSALVPFILDAALTVPVHARPATPVAPELFKTLPQADAVVTMDGPALFGKAIPALLSTRAESKAKLDANVARLQTDFGLDVRQVRQVAISASLFGASVDWVAALDGKFDTLAVQGVLARTLDDFVKRNPRYDVRAETHEGTLVYVLPEKVEGGGTVERTAVAALDATTALYGTPGAVRRAIDVRKGKAASAAADATLVEAYGQSDATSPVRAGLRLDAIVKAQLAADPDDPFVKTLVNVRYVFGSLGLTGAGGLALKLTARAVKPEDARPVQTTLAGLLDLVRSQTTEKPEQAALLNLVTVTTTGADVVVAADVPQAQLDTLFRLVDGSRPAVAER